MTLSFLIIINTSAQNHVFLPMINDLIEAVKLQPF